MGDAHDWGIDRPKGFRCVRCGVWSDLPHARTKCRPGYDPRDDMDDPDSMVGSYRRPAPRAAAERDGEEGRDG